MDNSDSRLVKLSIYHSPKISTSEQTIDPLINLISFYPEECFSQRLYLVEWCRQWWLRPLRECRTIPQTQGLGEWPNSRRYCSLVGAGSSAVNLIGMCDIGNSPTTLFATYLHFQWWCQGWCGILHFRVAKEHLACIHHCRRPQNARKMKVIQRPGNQRTGYVHHHLSFSTCVWHMIYPPTKLYNFFRGCSCSCSNPKSSPKSTTITITNPDSHPHSQSVDVPPLPHLPLCIHTILPLVTAYLH